MFVQVLNFNFESIQRVLQCDCDIRVQVVVFALKVLMPFDGED